MLVTNVLLVKTLRVTVMWFNLKLPAYQAGIYTTWLWLHPNGCGLPNSMFIYLFKKSVITFILIVVSHYIVHQLESISDCPGIRLMLAPLGYGSIPKDTEYEEREDFKVLMFQ